MEGPLSRELRRWYEFNVGLLLVAVFVPIYITCALHRYHNHDLGIFAQALRAFRFDDLNPFIGARNLRIFNDHFDPILILAAPLAHLGEPAYVAIALEHLLALLAPIPLLLLLGSGAGGESRSGSIALAFAATTYLLLNAPLLSALRFPVHPTTWAGAFVVLLAVGRYRRRLGLMAVAAILLMACKEEFPFAVGAIGIALLARRETRAGVTLILLAAAWAALAFAIRPLLLGPTYDHASRVLGPLWRSPIQAVMERAYATDYLRGMLECFVPLLPILHWRLKQGGAPDWPLLIGAVPLLAIRYIGGAWGFQYMAPVAALAGVSMLGPSATPLPWRRAWATVVLTLLVSTPQIVKGIGVYRAIPELRGARVAAIEDARGVLLHERDGAALVHGNLTPLLAARPDVYPVGMAEGPAGGGAFRFLLLEKPPHGRPYPVTNEAIEQLIVRWRGDPDIRILRDDSLLFFAENPRFLPRPPHP